MDKITTKRNGQVHLNGEYIGLVYKSDAGRVWRADDGGDDLQAMRPAFGTKSDAIAWCVARHNSRNV